MAEAVLNTADILAAGGASAAQLALKANIASPALTGSPTAPTPTEGDNTTKIATTEFVTTAVAAGGGASPANPTATAGATAVNGVATTFMRSDAAPAVAQGSSSVKGIVQVDGTTITATGGVISAVGGGGASPANPTATASDTAVNGVATTFMRSDAAPAVQLGSSSAFGLVKVDGTTITATSGVISAVGGGSGDVTGPASSTSGGFAKFNGTTGKLLQSSAAVIAVADGGTGITAFGTGVATGLGVNVGSAGAFVVQNGALGTPSSGTLTSCTGLPISTGVSGLGTGVATFLATPTSANLIAVVTNETGTGSLVFATSPTLVTPALGTPSSGTLTSCTGLPISTGVSGLGTGVATALAVNIGSAGAPVTFNGALGTPSSGTLTNATGLPVSTGVSGLGTGVATFLATPSSANLAAAVTGETGSGALVFATSPTLVTPALGTPSSGTLTSCTGLPISTGVGGLGTGVATALAVNIGSAGAPVTFNGAGGTPSSLTLTNATGLPVAGGGTGAATFTDGGVLIGNGTGAVQVTAAGSAGQVLTSNGAGLDPTFQSVSGTGDVLGPATNTADNVPQWNGANSKTLKDGRAIGVANSTDLPDRAAADTRYLTLSGGTLTGPLITVASGTGAAGLNLPPGTAPSAPNNGDLWSTSTGVYARVNGSTVGPFSSGGGSGDVVGPASATDGGFAKFDTTTGKLLKSSPAVIVAADGGTGQSSYTTGDLLQASSSSALSALASVATGNVLISGGVGTVSSWGKVGLTTHVSGTLPVANGGTGITAFGTGVATALGVNVGSAGAFVTFNGALGTPSSATLTNATGLPVSTGVSGLGTGVATALAVNIGSAGAPVTFNGALGTPSSATLTNATGLPIASGVSGLAAGAATFLATPSSANLAALLTDETGSGANVFATSPTLVTPLLGTPTSGNLSNCTVDGTSAVGFREIPQNSQSTAYTAVLADNGKHLFHPAGDNNARTFTIPANSSVAYPIGTTLTFVNMINTMTIAITTDTLILSPTGATGSRSLAANGMATALKVTSTSWMISGSGLT